MANPTTNYSFAMPTNTDLVKDLPADFDIFGQAVDDRIKALNPETTAGDISYRASTANAKSRLAIGTAGQVLTVNSGATAPEWKTAAGGMSLINTGGTTLTGASVTISSIPGTYKYLKLIIEQCRPATDGTYIMMRFNGDSTSSRYQSKASSYDASGGTFSDNHLIFTNDMDNGTSESIMIVDIYGYANTATWKYGFSQCVQNNQTTSTNFNSGFRTLFYNQTAAITSIYLAPSSGNFTSGTAYLYGVS